MLLNEADFNFNFKEVMYMKKTFITASLLTASLLITTNVSAVEHVKHEIQWGDTLTQIALDYNTSIKSVADINNIDDIDLIYVNDILKIHQGNTDLKSKTVMSKDKGTTIEKSDVSDEEVINKNQSITEQLAGKQSKEGIYIQSVLEKFEEYDFKY